MLPVAAATSTRTRPAPIRDTEYGVDPSGLASVAVSIRRDLISATVQLGWSCLKIAAAPATCGEENEVPETGVASVPEGSSLAGTNRPDRGLYRSPVAIAVPVASNPPQNATSPSGSSVAVCP